MKDLIKLIRENPKGKAFLFFIFYGIFFLVIICVLFFGKSDYTKPEEYEKGTPNDYSSLFSVDDNYAFIYTISLDDNVYYYKGQKNGDAELFQYAEKNYYKLGNDFYVYDGIWTKCENPYIYSQFLDVKNIDAFLNLATYLSKTTYDSGKITYNFLLSTNIINKEISDVITDFSEEPNQLILSMDEDKNVDQVSFLLDSYCSLNNLCEKSLKIDIQYGQVGMVGKIDNPIV